MYQNYYTKDTNADSVNQILNFLFWWLKTDKPMYENMKLSARKFSNSKAWERREKEIEAI